MKTKGYDRRGRQWGRRAEDVEPFEVYATARFWNWLTFLYALITAGLSAGTAIFLYLHDK